MEARATSILKFLHDAPQFVIPIFQRHYCWGDRECRQLWDDILHAGEMEDARFRHFIGSIAYVAEKNFSVTAHPPLMVIDGQQRLTAITLLLIALADSLGDNRPVDGMSSRQIRSHYLLDDAEEGDRHFKLLLSDRDRDTLLGFLGAPAPRQESQKIRRSFDFFRRKLAGHADRTLATLVWKGLTRLHVVDISLDREIDNPQLIFESLNFKGHSLCQADLIRNYLLMGLEGGRQKDCYSRFWKPMEDAFPQEGREEHLDAFMRHYITLATRSIPRFDRVYEAFKKLVPTPGTADVEGRVEDMLRHARRYCRMAFGGEPDLLLREAFADVRNLDTDVACPALLRWYQEYEDGAWSREDFLGAVRLLESYVFRRAVCGIPTHSLNRTFASFGWDTEAGTNGLEGVTAAFALLSSHRRFPGNDEFWTAIQERNLYGSRLKDYWPWKMENFRRRERVSRADYSIEHIMPQALTAQWRKALGDDCENVHEEWLHRLGNLTLTGCNSQYSNRSFEEKRDMPGGFRESPLHLNKGLGMETAWNREAIERRGRKLADLALEVWPYPAPDPAVLEKYRASSRMASIFGGGDGEGLRTPDVDALFETLKRSVLKLPGAVVSPCKRHVACRTEAGVVFLDVNRQAQGLRLDLHIEHGALDDPRGASRPGPASRPDLSIATISRTEDIDGVMPLVSQAFETRSRQPLTKAQSLCDVYGWKHLQQPEIGELFEGLNREVMELPGVKKRLCMDRVAYLTETNFIFLEVFLRKKGPVLALYAKEGDIEDPRGVGLPGDAAKGVSRRVNLPCTEGLDYVMTLVRQAFEAGTKRG